MGIPTKVPQNGPHDALIILNIHNWGKKIFRKNLPISSGSHQPRSDLEVRLGVKFCVFHPFLNSPRHSEHFKYRHVGNEKQYPLRSQDWNSNRPPPSGTRYCCPVVQYTRVLRKLLM